MATAPVKSQTLHNFSLPTFLKWGGGSSSHHQRFRRSAPPGESPVAEADSDRNESDPDSRPPRVGSRHNHRSLLDGASSGIPDKPHGRLRDLKAQNQTINAKNDKISFKNDEKEKENERAEVEAETPEEEVVERPWNLRPRRPRPSRQVREFIEDVAVTTQSPAESQQLRSMRLRGVADTPLAIGGEKKEKRRFWVALSKEEIEEDIFVMTGSRPARRPKKWPKHIQKQLNTVLPGMWLVGASADDFRLSDAQPKVFPSFSLPL
ncbi:hypothetical protein SAY86_021329 [Trapa natans]|uniref:Uncharacterized protein n=1 Tax=Trapa natans TaxID=22666 RepID=A0AAN7MK83_TRANT|nr:hypothetical protein SAY86_021329 [Trapa natans]